MNTEGAIESVHTNGLSVLSRLNLEEKICVCIKRVCLTVLCLEGWLCWGEIFPLTSSHLYDLFKAGLLNIVFSWYVSTGNCIQDKV